MLSGFIQLVTKGKKPTDKPRVPDDITIMVDIDPIEAESKHVAPLTKTPEPEYTYQGYFKTIDDEPDRMAFLALVVHQAVPMLRSQLTNKQMSQV